MLQKQYTVKSTLQILNNVLHKEVIMCVRLLYETGTRSSSLLAGLVVYYCHVAEVRQAVVSAE